MKRVVMLTRNYKPLNSAVGICMSNIADCLKERAEISVVCEKSTLDEPSEELIDGERVVRFLSRQTRLRKKYTDNKARAASPFGRAAWRFAHEAVRAGYNIRFILGRESIQKELVECYLDALRSMPLAPDLLIPTCMPMEALIASKIYCDENPLSKYVPMLFDRFADNETLHRTRLNKKLTYVRNQDVEQTVLGSPKCAGVLFVDAWQDRIQAMDGIAPARQVEHPLLVERRNEAAAVFDEGETSLVYTGTLTTAGRDPSYALRLVSAVLPRLHNAVFHVFGLGDGMRIVEESSERFPRLIRSHGAVSSKRAQDILSCANVLLSVGNSDIAQMPSKIFEYMAAGKPIIHVAKSSEDPANDILSRYPLGLVLVEDDAHFDEQAEQMRYYIQTHCDDSVDFDLVARRFPSALPSYTAELISRYL